MKNTDLPSLSSLINCPTRQFEVDGEPKARCVAHFHRSSLHIMKVVDEEYRNSKRGRPASDFNEVLDAIISTLACDMRHQNEQGKKRCFRECICTSSPATRRHPEVDPDLTVMETCSSQGEQICVNETCSSQRERIYVLEHQLEMAQLQITEGEKLRRKLHNIIMELKGNIRVFCRVRPLLPEEAMGNGSTHISFPTSIEALGRGIDLTQSGQKYSFTFDKVFTHEASQRDVFVEISQLVQSAVDGYKVCIFAYGQTGSGKTYTMMGRPESSEQKGLIQRSLEQIFQSSQSLESLGWKYKVQVSMLEIYGETISDLLSTHQLSDSHTIKIDVNGNTYVPDLTIIDVCGIREVSSLLEKAAHRRSTGSHLIIKLRISGVNESTEQQVQGVLNLIDLAGSQRKSGVTGDRLKETQAINSSLFCLSSVILALVKKKHHVPFRNSKLTYLLQPYLGGDSKTLMLVNISPDPASVNESLCSLRFAARANGREIGISRRQTITQPSKSRSRYVKN